MAQRTTTTLVDDLDGTELASGEGEVVEFGLDRATYEIDLSDDNAKHLRNALSDYIDHARRISGRKTTGRAPKAAGASRAKYSRETSSHQREWARDQGFTVSDRGRLPGDALAAWEQAHPTQVA